MKTKKKFGMRRHIGITAAATLIALGATACEEAYWGGEKNHDTYKGLINNFNTEDGSFDSTLNCKDSDNCFWNEMHDGCSTNVEDNIQNLKILLAPNIKSDADKRLVVICSKWMEGKDSYELIMESEGTLKIDKGISIDDNVINYYNDWLCKPDSERKLGRLICDEIAYYLYDGNTYSKCDKGKCGDLDKEMPKAFKNAFNYRACPDGYDYRAKYIGDLTNVCVKSVCNGVSINLYTDNDNCGTCGKKCESGYTCVNGKCKIANEDTLNCNGNLIDPKNNPEHCGAKGTCDDTESTSDNYKGENCANNATDKLCAEGKCTSSCPSGQIACNKKCIDPRLDTKYCGAKGTCDDTESTSDNYKGENCANNATDKLCAEGKCTSSCPSGQIACNKKCIDPRLDTKYCGAKGTCDDTESTSDNYKGENCANNATDKLCAEGKCTSSCPSGQIACNKKCIDPSVDTTYCGAKGSCEGIESTSTNYKGENCADNPTNKLCSGGNCTSSCPSGQIACNNKCIDPKFDNRYCGAKDDCEGANVGTKCADGEVCSVGSCGVTCVSGQVLCNGQCIDPKTDNRYCGASGNCKEANAGKQCGSGQVCSGGTCGVTCVSGQVLCNGQCIDPKTDNRYCGAEGNCSDANAGSKCKDGEVCSGGKCGITCVSGQILCNSQCIDPKTNPFYCGATGNCQGTNRGTDCTQFATNKLCANNTCTSSCPTGQTQCDGFCINMNATNVSSCNNATIQCKAGYGNCDNDKANGCEVDTSNDNAHCGGCGKACTTAIVQNSASVQCSNGGCKATSCARGYVLKNGECKVSNTLDCCGTLCTNCYEKYPNMKEGSCNITDSTCTLQSCNVGYVVSSDGKKCDVAKCLDNGACGDSGKCINGECKCGTNLACSGDKPICNGNVCVACTNQTHCPSVLNASATCTKNVCSYKCDTSYGNVGTGNNPQTIQCKDCSESFKFYLSNPFATSGNAQGECVQCSGTNNVDKCYVHLKDRKAVEYGCDNSNACIINECEPGYHVSSDKKSCEADSIEACGTHDKSCVGENGLQGLATQNEESVECVAGECKAKACIQHQYYLDDGKCKASDNQNCGSKGLSCEAHNGTGTSGSVLYNAYICNVNNGKCELKCQDGKILKDDSCVNCSDAGECGDSNNCSSGFGSGRSKKCYCPGKDASVCSPGGGCELNSCTYPSKDPVSNS